MEDYFDLMTRKVEHLEERMVKLESLIQARLGTERLR